MTMQEGYTALFLINTLLKLGALKNHWNNLAKYALDLNYITENPAEVMEKVTKYYLGSISPKDATLDQISEVSS